MYAFIIFRVPSPEHQKATPAAARQILALPIMQFTDPFEACVECIEMEQQSGLRYEVRVLDRVNANDK